MDAKCSANVFSAGKTEVASYYELWEAVTAIFTVCVWRSKIGSVRGVGTEIDEEREDMKFTYTDIMVQAKTVVSSSP